MIFQSREFRVPKDYDTPQYYEDASAVNAEAGRVAIADGVGSAVFSGAWAEILTRSVAANPPNVRESAEFAAWLATCRKEWAAGIHVPSLPYHLLMKLRQVGGGFATLAWIDVQRVAEAAGTDAEFVIRGRGVGDACVFQSRSGQIIAKWPMQQSADFDADPISIGSVNFQRDQALEFQEFEWQCRAGDVLILATDAISAWAYKMLEAGEALNWEDLSQLTDDQLAGYVTALRESHWLKRDDTTIVFVGLGRTEPFLAAAATPSETETAAAAETATAAVNPAGSATCEVAEPAATPADVTTECKPADSQPVVVAPASDSTEASGATAVETPVETPACAVESPASVDNLTSEPTA